MNPRVGQLLVLPGVGNIVSDKKELLYCFVFHTIEVSNKVN